MTFSHTGVESKDNYTIAGILKSYRAYCESCDFHGSWCIAPDIPEASIRAHLRNEHGYAPLKAGVLTLSPEPTGEGEPSSAVQAVSAEPTEETS